MLKSPFLFFKPKKLFSFTNKILQFFTLLKSFKKFKISNYAVKTDRVASFLNLPIKVSLKNTSETNYEYNAQELYKYMRSAVVLIVGQE